MKADWIVEGEILSVSEEHGQRCATNMGCIVIWRGGHVVLSRSNLKIPKGTIEAAISGSITSANWRVRINAGSHCWQSQVRVAPSLVGKRVRFYGLDGPFLYADDKPGYFAFEVVK
ncbi:MAG: hypothetical protein K2Y40_13305 [Reyranella sp.]|nr:hypothetical protein [Reyranella sp.]